MRDMLGDVDASIIREAVRVAIKEEMAEFKKEICDRLNAMEGEVSSFDAGNIDCECECSLDDEMKQEIWKIRQVLEELEREVARS